MSYADKIFKAENPLDYEKAVQAGLSHYGMIFNGLIHTTPWDDMPFLVAVMQMGAQAMRPAIGESGCQIVDQLVAETCGMVINAGALGKERGEE